MTISSITLLPKPFAWITIPEGQVNIVSILSKEGRSENYIPSGTTQVFDVAPFQIAKYPTTNAQFAQFIQAGGYAQQRWWTEKGWEERVKGGWDVPNFWDQAKWNQSDYPVVGISWYEAVAFTRWLSKVTDEAICLPTEEQWQHAVQGEQIQNTCGKEDWESTVTKIDATGIWTAMAGKAMARHPLPNLKVKAIALLASPI
jgi:formylglycine-generating enzyme required for sulfatase activity